MASNFVEGQETDKLRLAVRPVTGTQQTHRTLPPTKALLSNQTFRTVASGLAIVLGVFALLTALFRTQHVQNQSVALMQTLGAIQLTPKVKLHLVRLGNRLLVLYLSENSVQRIAEISDPDEVSMFLGSDNHETTSVPSRVDELLQAVDGVAIRSDNRGAIGS